MFFLFLKMIKNVLFHYIHNYYMIFSWIVKIDGDIRLNVFIGVTGLTVAVIIYVAEMMNEKYKKELEKKLLLKKTNIVRNIGFCLIIFLLIVVFSLFKNEYGLIYFLLQSLLNYLMIAFAYHTFYMFNTAIKLSSDSKYFKHELELFVKKQVIDIENYAISKSFEDKDTSIKEFNSFIKNNKNVSVNIDVVNLNEELYEPIYLNRSGIVRSFNYKKIDSIIENILDEGGKGTKIYISEDDVIFIFIKSIGDKVNNNDIIGYCLKSCGKSFASFNDCIIYQQYDSYIGDDLDIIYDYYFSYISNYSKYRDYDEFSDLYDYFEFLYQYNYEGVRRISLESLESFIGTICDNIDSIRKYLDFLDRISMLAYTYNIYEEYVQINRLIYHLYYLWLEREKADKKEVTFEFALNYFRHNYYTVKENEDLRYYDHLLANLLKLICTVLNKKYFDELYILLNNLTLEHRIDLTDEFDEKDACNLQFSIGIITCLIILSNNNTITNTDNNNLSLLINWLNTYFINTDDACKLIINFRKIYNKNSSILKVYRHLDLDLIDHEYRSSWSAVRIDDKEVLRELLCISSYMFISEDSFDNSYISKDDKFYYEQLNKILMNTEKTKFEEVLSINFESNKYSKLLKTIIMDATDKECEYNKHEKLDSNIKNSFKAIIMQELNNKSELEMCLEKNSKIEYSNLKLNRVCGTSQLIPREVFFKGSNYYKSYAKSFNNVFDRVKEEEFIKIIKKISKSIPLAFKDCIEEIEKPEDFILIGNFINVYHLNYYNQEKKKIILDKGEIDILIIPTVKDVYLIKKRYLPKLQYCKFNNDFINKYIIDDNLFFELRDCSKDEGIRNEIIQHSSWLSEKGDVEYQHEYLKRFCSFKFYSSFKYVKTKGAKAIRFRITNKNS